MWCFLTSDSPDVSLKVMIYWGRTFSFYHAYLVMIVTPGPTFYKFMMLEGTVKLSAQCCMYSIKMGVTGVGVYFIMSGLKLLKLCAVCFDVITGIQVE